jgi:hypothetical protein
MIDQPRGPLSFRGGGSFSGTAIIIAIVAAILMGTVVLMLSGCGTLSPSQKPEQTVAPVVAPAVAGTGNMTTTTTDTTSNQHSEQTTAGTNVRGPVGAFTQNSFGLSPLQAVIIFVLACWIIAAFLFGIVAHVEVQGGLANVVCWIGVGLFGVVIPCGVIWVILHYSFTKGGAS